MERGSPARVSGVNRRVLVVESNGGGLKEIARNSRAPAWSPGGRRVAFMSDMDPEELARTVTIAGADGSRPAEVEALNGDIGPVWSPAGGEIAFQAHRTEALDLWINLVRPDGTSRRWLAPGRNPTWSPDGRRLAFIDNSNRLITMTRTANESGVSRGSASPVVAAAWSPKGDTLAFPSGRPNPYGGRPRDLRLETVRANGTRLLVLARESGSSLLSGRPDLDAERQAHPRQAVESH